MQQLTFEVKGGEYSDCLLEEASYQGAVAASMFCHRFIGWIWTGSNLQVKDSEVSDEGDDETCHYALFGNQIYRCPFRGWFNPHKKILTFMAKAGDVPHTDMIPERVYQHLTRRFGRDIVFKLL